MRPRRRTIPDTAEGPSSLDRHGLFTTVDRAPGEVLCRLDGEILAHRDDAELLGSTEWNALSDEVILLRRDWTDYCLINHSPTPNLTIDPVTHDLLARSAIPAGTELSLDYLENGFPQAYLRSDRCAYLR